MDAVKTVPRIKLMFQVYISLIFLFMLSASAQGEVKVKDGCFIFTSKDESAQTKFCVPDHTTYTKAKPPVWADGREWNWVAHEMLAGRLFPGARNGVAFVGPYIEYLVGDQPENKRYGRPRYGGKPLVEGYRLMYFAEDGRLITDKIFSGRGTVVVARISYDGSLIVLVLQQAISNTGLPEEKKHLRHLLVVLDKTGRKLLEIYVPGNKCPIASSDLWLSKTGKYIMFDCYSVDHNSLFFQPKAGLFWEGDRHYVIPYHWEERVASNTGEWTQEDEEYGRMSGIEVLRRLTKYVTTHENTDLVLAGVDWKPIEEFSQK